MKLTKQQLKQIIKEELEKVLLKESFEIKSEPTHFVIQGTEEGVTDNWLIERYKTIADMAESDNAKLRSLDSLSKISGLFEQSQIKSEKLEIWAGFSPEQLEEVKKHGQPEIIAHAKRETEEEAC